MLCWKCRCYVMSRNPPKWHVVRRHADMSWKCREYCPNILSDSVVWTMPVNMRCHVWMTCWLILFDIKKWQNEAEYRLAHSLPTFMSTQPWQTFGGFWFGGFWFGGFRFGGFWVDGFPFDVVWVCCGFSIGWFGGVGPVSCLLGQILLQQVSEFPAVVLGKQVLRRCVWRLQFGNCWIQAVSGTSSRHLSPQVSPRPQNPALPNPMRGKPRVCPCRSRQIKQSTN